MKQQQQQQQQQSAAATAEATATAAASNENEGLEDRSTRMIDNRGLVYVPVRMSLCRRGRPGSSPCCGDDDDEDGDEDDSMMLCCRPDVLTSSNETKILQVLQSDIRECLEVLPPSVHALILRTRLWLNTSFVYGPVHKQRHVKHLTTHHTTQWLEWAYDTVAKVHGIEIYNVQEYLEMRHHWNGCGLLLHEFCHLIHQIVLDLSNQQIQLLFHDAKRSRKYNSVLRRDWAGMSKEVDMAYAMVNHKEFFAEMSVTFLCQVKTPPDPLGADKHTSTKRWLSPPLTSPRAIRRVCKKGIAVNGTSKRQSQTRRRRDHYSTTPTLALTPANGDAYQPLEDCSNDKNDVDTDDVWFVCQEESKDTALWRRRRCRCCSCCCQANDNDGDDCCSSALSWILGREKKRRVIFCNKFYPFTREQLARHDPDLEEAMAMLWKEIEDWRDPWLLYGYNDDYKKDDCCPSRFLLFRSEGQNGGGTAPTSSLLLSTYEPVHLEGPGDTVCL